jgi:hypothetical protein
MYEVKQAGAKGLGVFAKVRIPRGTRIFSEKPLLAIRTDQNAGDVYTASRLLSPSDRLKLLQLSAHEASSALRWMQVLWYTAKQIFSDVTVQITSQGSASNRRPLFIPSPRALKEHKHILSIFRTNNFAFGNDCTIQQALCVRIARLNHSCIPNAQGNFHEVLGRFNVHATRDIAANEELTINYLPEHGAAHAARLQRLTTGYGFTCGCPACDLGSSRGREGEQRRLKMQRDLSVFAESAEQGNVGVEMELETLRKYIRFFEDEGISGRELSSM